jgi:anti-sigma B factor antagonist
MALVSGPNETWPLFQMQDDRGVVLAEAECAEHEGPEGREWFVKLGGELDCYTVPRLREALAFLTDDGRWVRVDMTQVSFMDSSGAGLLVEAHDAVECHGGKIEIVAASPCVRTVLEVLNLDRVVAVRPGD